MANDNRRPIRLVLLDDHDLARSRSVARLSQQPLLDIIGETADSTEAVRLARELHPDALLVETSRLDERGLEAIALLSSLDVDLRPAIVVYVEILNRDDWTEARAAGADDVLLKEMRTEAIAQELQAVVDRRRSTTPDVRD